MGDGAQRDRLAARRDRGGGVSPGSQRDRAAGVRPGRVAVVGGGLAGIAAALDCADAGAEVTLVEARPRLGGAAYSFEHDGLVLDNGQHVFLRCCTAYRALLRRLGSDTHTRLQRRLELPVLSPGRRPVTLRRSGLPAPLHLARALAGYRHLRRRERIAAVGAALALGRLDPNDPRLDDRNLGEWLAEHGQSPNAIAALWDLIALPTLNLPAAQASLALGAFVFRTGLLDARDAGDIGFHERPLQEIVGDPAERALRAAGVDVRLRWGARGVVPTSTGFEVRGPQETLAADRVVVAVPHHRAEGLLPEAALAGARRPGALAGSPIVNLHVVYDRQVCELPFAAAVGTPVQYLFDRSDAAGLERGQYLAISLSGADAELGLGAAELRRRYLTALEELLPRARQARVERLHVTREHSATFRAAPGVAALRPPAHTSLPGLALAGAYTATGWPATMEGAVRSGHAAADVVLEQVARAGRARATTPTEVLV
jgi:squalene-associated FAD-dependent desaturase